MAPRAPSRTSPICTPGAKSTCPARAGSGSIPPQGLLAGEGHLPLACSPEPSSAAPITGAVDECKVEFDFAMSVARLRETPR
jgi:hypothetical protein